MFYKYMKNHYLKNINKSIRTKRTLLEWGSVLPGNASQAGLLRQVEQLVDSRQQELERMGLPVVEGETAVMLWPTYFDSTENPDYTIDISAACFGALILHGTGMGQEEDEPEQKNAAIRTVILLRNEDGSWPSHYAVGQSLVYSGTYNETTIALATLMRYGFLDASVPREYLQNRLKFFRESLGWLIDNKRGDFDGASWGFSPFQKEHFSSTMQTAFVYEILVKYRNIMQKLPDEYRETTGKLGLERIDSQIAKAERFFRHVQSDNGGFPNKVSQHKKGEECVVNTCMVINALSSNPDSGKGREVMKKAVNYLIREWGFKSAENGKGKVYECGKGFCFTRDECFEEFVVNVSQRPVNDDHAQGQASEHTKVFEKFPLTLIILSSLCLLQTDKTYSFLSKHERYTLRKYIKKGLKLLEGAIVRQDGSICVKGFRGGDREYPIYNIYYAMLVFTKIIRQGEELHLGILPVDMLDICRYFLLTVLLLLLIGLSRGIYLLSLVLTAFLGVSIEHLWQGASNYLNS